MAGLITRACRITPILWRTKNKMNEKLFSCPGSGVISVQPQTLQHVRAITNVSMVAKMNAQIDTDSEAVLKTYFKNLERGIQQQNRIMRFNLEGVLYMVEKYRECSQSQAMLMIKSCGEVMVDINCVERGHLLQSVLNTLDKAGITLDISLHNTLLKVNRVTNAKQRKNQDVSPFPGAIRK